MIARNDDYYSSDSWLDLWLEAGIYYIAVTSTGNVGFDPQTDNTGFGGTSEGLYELNLSFVADSASTLVDAPHQTRLDGDSDGSPGGQFDFWFQSGPTIFVDKMNSTTSAPEGNGSLADPYDTISAALAAAASRIVVPATGGQALTDGDQILIGDGTHAVAVFEFDQDGQTRSGNHPIVFDAAYSPAELAAAIAAAINACRRLEYHSDRRRVRRAIGPGGSAGRPRHASRCSPPRISSGSWVMAARTDPSIRWWTINPTCWVLTSPSFRWLTVRG